MWIETMDNGQFLNTELVERFSVDHEEDLYILNAHVPSGKPVAISMHKTFAEGVEALREVMDRVRGSSRSK